MDKVQNYLSNSFQIFNLVRQPENIVGIGEIVLFETITSILFYQLFMPEKYPGLWRVMTVHLVSLPFLAAIPLSDFGQRATLKSYLSQRQSVKQAIEVSSRGIPAVFVSQFIVGTVGGENVIRIPKVTFPEVLVTAGSKFITRPLLQLIYTLFGWRPEALKKFDNNILKQEGGNFGRLLRFLKQSGTEEESNVFLDAVKQAAQK